MAVDPKTNLQPSIDKVRREEVLQNNASLNGRLNQKQDTLVPGVNLKRINGVSLIGDGFVSLEQLGVESGLSAGENITIDRTNPAIPIINANVIDDAYAVSVIMG